MSCTNPPSNDGKDYLLENRRLVENETTIPLIDQPFGYNILHQTSVLSQMLTIRKRKHQF